MKARSVLGVALTLGALLIAASSANASGYLYLAAGTDDQGGSAARVFALNENGIPSALQSVNASGTFYNAVSMTPDGKYLYMADYNGNTIGGYAVGADGKLTNLPGFPLELPPDYGPYGSAVTPDGKFAVFGLYDGEGAVAYAIGADGSLSPTPGGPVDLDAWVYSVAVSPDGRTMYAVDPYSGLYALRIAPDGELTNLPESPYPAGDEPYQAAITPNGKYLYVPDYSNDNVNGYSLDADGAPTPLPGSPFAGVDDPYGGLEVSPDGRTLYVSGSDAIEHLAIAEDGALTAGDPVSVGAYNPSLALNPAGTRLYNVSQNGDDLLTTYTRSDSGVLTALGTPLDLADNPSPDTDSLVVSPAQPPAAALEADVAGKRVVSFDASASADSDGEIVSYAWDFGDGSTATTTTPTTTHKYAKDGRFTATVTVTDADNCSSELVYASRNTYCNGSDVATAEAVADSGVEGAKVKAKKTQKQKRKLLIKVKAGAKEAVRLQAKGSAKVKGLKGKVKLKQAKGKAKAGKTKVLKLKAKSKKKGKAAAGRKGKATVKVELTDEYGATASKKVKVKLK